MSFFGNLFMGRLGLAKTFWLWGILVPVLASAVVYGVSFATISIESDAFNLLDIPFSIIVAIWECLIANAILRAATYERTRGVWGWIASIFAIFLAIGSLLKIAAAFFLSAIITMLPPGFYGAAKWANFEEEVRAENAALPKDLGAGRILTAKTVSGTARTLTYSIDVATASIKDPAAYGKLKRPGEVKKCAVHIFDFIAGARLIKFVHKAKDGTTAEFQLSPEDCGAPPAPETPVDKKTTTDKQPAAAKPTKAAPAEVAPTKGMPATPKQDTPTVTDKAATPVSKLAGLQKIIAAGGADAKAAANTLRGLALRGDTAAQIYLGDLHLAGNAVMHNLSLAAIWYTEAAEEDDAEAQYKLALLYRDGTGVVRSPASAREWLTRAAEAGHSKARQLLREWGIKPPPLKAIKPIKIPKKSDTPAEDKASQ